MDVAAHVGEAFGAEFVGILKDIDVLIGPEQTNDDSTGRDTPPWDEQTPATVSPIVGSGEGARPNGVQSETRLSSLPSTTYSSTTYSSATYSSATHSSATHPSTPLPRLPPPDRPPTPPRTKKKSTVNKTWNKLKKFTKKLLGRDRAAPKLSDNMVPERDDRVGQYGPLFLEPAMTRK